MGITKQNAVQFNLPVIGLYIHKDIFVGLVFIGMKHALPGGQQQRLKSCTNGAFAANLGKVYSTGTVGTRLLSYRVFRISASV